MSTSAAKIAALPLRAVAAGPDGLTWSLTVLQFDTPDQPPMLRLCVRGKLAHIGQFSETTDVTREQLADSIRQLVEAVGIGDLLMRAGERVALPTAPVPERRAKRPVAAPAASARRATVLAEIAPNGHARRLEALILELLGADPSQEFSRAEIAEFCETQPTSLSQALTVLLGRGDIRRAGRGLYRATKRGKL